MKLISSSSKGSFKLVEGDREISELVYTSWFSGKASALYNGNSIEIKPKNIWSSKHTIYKNNLPIGDIKFTLKGHMVIRLEKSTGEELIYTLRNNGFWKLKFNVYNNTKALQFSMISFGGLLKLNHNYEIELAEFDSQIDLNELLIYCGYAAKLYIAYISSS